MTRLSRLKARATRWLGTSSKPARRPRTPFESRGLPGLGGSGSPRAGLGGSGSPPGKPHPPPSAPGKFLLPGRTGESIDGSGRVKPESHVRPVHQIPERTDVVGLDILVLQIEGVLPDIDHQQWHCALTDVALVIVHLLCQQASA